MIEWEFCCEIDKRMSLYYNNVNIIFKEGFMDINQTITVKIIDTNENGVGIAKHDGMVVFVPGVITGEVAEIRITGSEKNFSYGECVNRISDSEHRIDDPCPSAALCGGCTLGFVTYEFENLIKQNTVKAALRRAGLDYSLVCDTVAADTACGYRNKIAVHYDSDKKIFGYKKEKSSEVIDFRGCLLCSTEMNRVIEWTNEHIDMIECLSPKSLNVRSSVVGITVSLYAEEDHGDYFEAYKTAVLDELGQIENVILISDKTAQNRTYIKDRIFGLDMNFTSETFRQVNADAFELLLTIVHEFAAEKPFRRCADLYCGSGIIGLSLANRFPESHFWGIEINEDAIEDAKKNAARNCINNIRFFSGDAASFKKRISEDRYPELIVVDPPRAGLSKEMRKDLKLLSPERIIYVSCNPQTMARDAAELCTAGYHLVKAVPVNMFPRTKHCETVAYLTK